MGKLILYIIALFQLLSYCSCTKPKRSNLSIEERKEVNLQYKAILDSLNKSMITECTQRKENTFDQMVDSLKKSRLEEIQLITKAKRHEK